MDGISVGVEVSLPHLLQPHISHHILDGQFSFVLLDIGVLQYLGDGAYRFEPARTHRNQHQELSQALGEQRKVARQHDHLSRRDGKDASE